MQLARGADNEGLFRSNAAHQGAGMAAVCPHAICRSAFRRLLSQGTVAFRVPNALPLWDLRGKSGIVPL